MLENVLIEFTFGEVSMISVIITTYGGGSQLKRAIDSVLSQTYTDFEVIVVDDNNPGTESRHLTENVMRKYENDRRISYLKHDRNMNGAAARNTGIQAARGEYISFLDDDDYYLPERFEKVLTALEKNGSLSGVYTGVDLQDENGYILGRVRPQDDLSIDKLLLDEMALGTGSNIFVKRDVIDNIHGFDVSFARRQDTEFMIRVCERGKVGYITECLVIKSVNGVYNIPRYIKLKDTIAQFISKFQKHVDQLGQKKNDFYAAQYSSLFDSALCENNKVEIEEALSLLGKYRKITVRDYMRAFVHIHHLRDNIIISKLINAEKYLKSKKMR